MQTSSSSKREFYLLDVVYMLETVLKTYVKIDPGYILLTQMDYIMYMKKWRFWFLVDIQEDRDKSLLLEDWFFKQRLLSNTRGCIPIGLRHDCR